jgi:hypothetical protein
VFQLPCNTNVPSDIECTGDSASYTVWARALGSPKGTPSATITLCAFDEEAGEVVCNLDDSVVLLVRNTGKQTFKNVTNQLTMLNATSKGDVPLFADEFHDWVWQYANQGLRLAQLRFYLEE